MRSAVSTMAIGAVAAVAVAGGVRTAEAGTWEGYKSGLVDVVSDPSAGWTWPNYKYESFANSAGTMSGGTLSQTVSTDYNARAVWYSFGYASGSGLTLGNSGLTSLSADVTVTGDTLQRLIQDPVDANNVAGVTTDISMAWYVMSQDSGSGAWNIWLSNAANRIDLNAIRGLGASTFSVGINAANFQSFPGYPQGSADFASTVASAQYFGLLITTATASGLAFDGMNIVQWIDVDGGAWNPYATQRNGNYGAYSAGSSTISISNAVPSPGAIALLGIAGFAGRRRRS